MVVDEGLGRGELDGAARLSGATGAGVVRDGVRGVRYAGAYQLTLSSTLAALGVELHSS